MITVQFQVIHTYPDGDYDRDKYIAEFKSLSDALTWAGFYHNKVDDQYPDGYSRDWFVRNIWIDHSRYDSRHYLQSDLTWDQIDGLPVNDIDQTIH